jgi:hypothetical protein|tara:strand:+ start:87 stop:743 length:657 start_codon:yes stop_codon:yes gene_type:complete
MELLFGIIGVAMFPLVFINCLLVALPLWLSAKYFAGISNSSYTTSFCTVLLASLVNLLSLIPLQSIAFSFGFSVFMSLFNLLYFGSWVLFAKWIWRCSFRRAIKATLPTNLPVALYTSYNIAVFNIYGWETEKFETLNIVAFLSIYFVAGLYVFTTTEDTQYQPDVNLRKFSTSFMDTYDFEPILKGMQVLLGILLVFSIVMLSFSFAGIDPLALLLQ